MKPAFTPPRPRFDRSLVLVLGLAAAVVLTMLFVQLVFQNVARGERLRAAQYAAPRLVVAQAQVPARAQPAAPGRDERGGRRAAEAMSAP